MLLRCDPRQAEEPFALSPLRMVKKESQHFGTRVRTGGVGVTASCIPSCPRVRCAVNGPQLRVDTAGGNQPRDGAATSARVDPTPFAAVRLPCVETLHEPRGIHYVNRGVRVTMKDDHGPLR